jgi:hypothetical protein
LSVNSCKSCPNVFQLCHDQDHATIQNELEFVEEITGERPCVCDENSSTLEFERNEKILAATDSGINSTTARGGS